MNTSKVSRIVSNYLNYGVPDEIATLLESKGLPLSTVRNTSKTNLRKNYDLEDHIIDLVKELITRSPIDDDDLYCLLSNSNYTCNVCKGIKGKSFIIHHIEEYSTSQDNSYRNLIVLCPTCHDLAHKENGLTNRITKEHLYKLKYNWEKEISNSNASILGKAGKIHEVDYVNIPRITELILHEYNKIPDTEYSDFLKKKNFILEDNSINPDILTFDNKSYPFDFGNAFFIKKHYWDIFQILLNNMDFIDLEEILTKKNVLQSDFIGRYCFYIGGLYGNSPKLPIDASTPACHIYFRRNFFYVEWKIDPKYLMSTTAILRLSDRTIYIVYGKVRSVGTKMIKDKKFIHIDIRPYVIGIPSEIKDRTPIIKYIKESEFNEEEYEDDYDEIDIN